MEKFAPIAVASLAALALAGCGGVNVQETLGLGKKPPDEFAVVKQAPLILPPNFSLRPPEPGAARPQEMAPRDQAQAALTGRRPAVPGDTSPLLRAGATPQVERSPGENALLSEARAISVDPSIRRKLNEEFSNLAERDRDFVDRLIFWQKPQPPGVIVDPEKEKQRLREAAAANTPPSQGNVPIIERRKRGILEDIF